MSIFHETPKKEREPQMGGAWGEGEGAQKCHFNALYFCSIIEILSFQLKVLVPPTAAACGGRRGRARTLQTQVS